MTRSWPAVAIGLILGMTIAGCLSAPVEDPAPETPPNQRGNDRLVLEDLPGGTPDTWNATLEAAPEWRLGQWWTVRVTDRFVDEVTESKVVVAGAEPDWFLTGMPRDTFDDGLMVLHVPGIGQVRKADLSWELHDNLFTPIRFPVKLDDTWNTMWQQTNVVATVVDVTDTTATVRVRPEANPDGLTLELVYDAEIGTISKMDITNYALVEIIDSGFEHEGIVTVPHEHTLVFFSVRVAGAVSLDYGEPGVGAPLDTITVDDDFDRVSFGLIATSVPGEAIPVSAGVFLARATAPDGKVYELQMHPNEGPIKISMHTHLGPGGDWEFFMIAGGAGAVIIEGIAYHIFDIDTKSGCLIDSEEHAHHGPGTEHPDTC
jgi:hypothetical protein